MVGETHDSENDVALFRTGLSPSDDNIAGMSARTRLVFTDPRISWRAGSRVAIPRDMLILLILLLVLALLGGGWGWGRYGAAGMSPAAIIVVILLVLLLAGRL